MKAYLKALGLVILMLAFGWVVFNVTTFLLNLIHSTFGPDGMFIGFMIFILLLLAWALKGIFE